MPSSDWYTSTISTRGPSPGPYCPATSTVLIEASQPTELSQPLERRVRRDHVDGSGVPPQRLGQVGHGPVLDTRVRQPHGELLRPGTGGHHGTSRQLLVLDVPQ